jgi:hypothetical protein
MKAAMTDPNTDLERETTGEQYVEGNMETDDGVASGRASIEDLDAASDDTPDSLATDVGERDDPADDLSMRHDDETPDRAP